MQQKQLEGEELLKRLQPADMLYLLDEKELHSSEGFASFLQKKNEQRY